MTREEQLVFCKQCIHREKDIYKGLVCELTHEQATFTDTCSDFSQDQSLEAYESEYNEIVSGDLSRKIPKAVIEELRANQNFQKAILYGAVAGVMSSLLWAFLSVATHYQFGIMAVGVGAIVGFAIKIGGKGIDEKFGILGAVISLLSVVLGNFLGIMGLISQENAMTLMEVLTMIEFSEIPDLMLQGFGILDYFFYGIAVYEGFKFSILKFSDEEFYKINKSHKRKTSAE